MADHAARDHATWSASATARNVHCPGALAISQGVEDKPSIHADTGTAVHQIAEKCLRTGVDASAFLGTVETAKARQIEITEELVNSAQMYVDYCRERLAAYEAETGEKANFWIEERFTLDDLQPPFDAGGTGDFVAHFPAWSLLEIVDLKNGMGIVDVEGNPQGRSYGLGAMLKHPGLDVDNVRVTIVQPRAPHADGRIRSETFTVATLIDWTADLLAAMNRSKQATNEFAAAGSNTVLLDEWRDKWLRPGVCKFCPVEGRCPALRRDALAVAKIWFDAMDEPRIGNAALDDSPEAIARDLDMIPMLEDWIKARRAFGHAQAEAGVDIPGYQLSDTIGNRKWSDEAAVLAMLAAEGFGDDQLYKKKPISPAQADKLLGAKRKALIEPFVVRDVTGTNLVSTAKTTRPPAKTTAQKYFEAT